MHPILKWLQKCTPLGCKAPQHPTNLLVSPILWFDLIKSTLIYYGKLFSKNFRNFYKSLSKYNVKKDDFNPVNKILIWVVFLSLRFYDFKYFLDTISTMLIRFELTYHFKYFQSLFRYNFNHVNKICVNLFLPIT